jgi:predicted oxidoreductase
LDFPLVTNQIELHPLQMDSLHDGTLDFAQEMKMNPMIWSPLAGGRLMNLEMGSSDARIGRVQAVLKKIANELGPKVTLDQVVFSWLLAHPSKPVVILGTNKIDRVVQATGSFSISLTNEQWFSIWEASMGKEVP